MKRIEFKYHPNLYNDEITDFGTREKPFSWQEGRKILTGKRRC